MIKILADKHIYKLDLFLPDTIDLEIYDPNKSFPDLNEFDALLVRTVSKINASTIPVIPSSLKVIGTASSGSDHIDKTYFRQNGIKVIEFI